MKSVCSPSPSSFKQHTAWVPVASLPAPDEGLGCLSLGTSREGSCCRSTELRPRLKYCRPHSTPPWFPRSPWPSPTPIPAPSHLLLVIGGIRQHCGHVEHDLVVLVHGVEGVRARGIRCGQGVGDTGGEKGESRWPEPTTPACSLEPLCSQPAGGQPFMPPTNVQATRSSALAAPLPLSPQTPDSSLGSGWGA